MIGTIPCGLARTIDFETTGGFKALGVYDCWEESPFRDGRLNPNVRIVDNPDTSVDPRTGKAANPSAKVLGAQRSRFGSNTFGVRVDLEQPFELTPGTKYVHVLVNRPVSGRVMLVGLGHFRDFADQGQFVEQFWQLSSMEIPAGQWCDAVFPVKGSGDIDINALVLVPDCESPHRLTDDFLFYIDDIEISDSAVPRTIADDYPMWAGDKATTTVSRADRITDAVGIKTQDGTSQMMHVSQERDKLVYHLIAGKRLKATPGQTLQPVIRFHGPALKGYVYLDKGNDGSFDPSDMLVTADLAGDADHFCTLPAFTIPADMKPGVYRMRFKVDSNTEDPGGSASSNDNIAAKAGSITDVMINIHDNLVTVNDHQLNGEVLAADGSKLNALKVPAEKDFTVKMNPEAGFVHKGMTITSGYLDRPAEIHGNPQFITIEIPAFDGDTFTIPAEYMDANILINGNMVEQKKTVRK